MLKLYHFPRSGNSREVKMVLAEKGIPYEGVNIRESKEITDSPEFKKASPKGKVPAIIDGDTYMSEAYDINLYLEETYPQNSVLPKEVNERESIRVWVQKYDKSLILKIGLLLIECLLKPKEQQKQETKDKLQAEIQSGLSEIETFLADKDYFFGEYSLADISLAPHLAALPRLGMSLDSFPRMNAWMNRVKARPSFEQSAG